MRKAASRVCFTGVQVLISFIVFHCVSPFLVAQTQTANAPGGSAIIIVDPGFSLQLERTFVAHELKGEAFSYVTFSPDGKKIATAASDGAAKLWTLDGKLLQRFDHGNMVFKVRFNHDGDRIVTAGYDGSAKIWTLDGALIGAFRHHRSAVTDALFNGNDELVTGSDDGSVALLRIEKEQPFAMVTQQGVARNLARASDESMIACAFDCGAVRVIDPSGHILHEFQTDGGRINDIRFSPDNSSLLTSSFTGSAEIWSIIDGRRITRLDAGDGDWVYGAQFSRDGSIVGTVSGTGLISLWSAEGKQLARYATSLGRVNSIDFSPTEDRFAVSDHSGNVLIFTYDRR
jgi:WD40 repeat protein